MKKIKVGIIGGTGKMGHFFSRYFSQKGCKVRISSRKTKLTPEKCAKESDIVIVSVPISNTENMIKKIGPHVNSNSLLMDTTSIKSMPVKTMLMHSKCEVIGMHPLFGPNEKSLKGQTIVLCPARPKKWMKWLKAVFRKDGARIAVLNARNHDRIMSLVQGLNHFSTLVVAHSIKMSGSSIEENLKFASPSYKMKMVLIGRILNQNPNLYADIEIMNPENKTMLDIFGSSSKRLTEIIKKRDKKEFLRYFNECAGYFGSFRKKAEKASDLLIDQMVKS